jgi:hypothetical protein
MAAAVAADGLSGALACCSSSRRTARLLAGSSTARIRVMQTVVLNAPLAGIGLALARFGSPAALWHAAWEAMFHEHGSWPSARLPPDCRWSYDTGAVRNATACCAAARWVCVGDAAGAAIVGVVGVLPYLLVATVLSSVWAGQAVARAHAKRATIAGGVDATPPPPAPSPWDAAAQGVYRALLMVVMNVGVALLDGTAAWLPGARLVAFTLCALVTGFTAVDAAWALEAVPLATRLRVGEERWAWILAFGVVPAAATFFGPPALNGAVYNVAFPWMVLTALSHGTIASPHVDGVNGTGAARGEGGGAPLSAADAGAGSRGDDGSERALTRPRRRGCRLPWLTPFAWAIVAAVDGWPRLAGDLQRWVRRWR